MNDLIFYPPAVTHDRQWYRFFTCGFIHADFGHLLFNMYSFYLFGETVENSFTNNLFYEKGKILYLLLYLSSLFFCLLPTYFRHRYDSNYRSLGASGAVSAVIFVAILLDPVRGIGFLFFRGLYIPGFIFGFLYLAISSWLDRRGRGNINHSAHIWGAFYGILFVIVAGFIFSDHNIPSEFVTRVQTYLNSL